VERHKLKSASEYLNTKSIWKAKMAANEI